MATNRVSERVVAEKTPFPIGADDKSPCFPGIPGLKTVTAKSMGG